MKKCPECGNLGSHTATYCVLCGSALDRPGIGPRGRFLFFLTPLALFIFATVFAWETGADNPFNAGAAVGSTLSLIFLVVGSGFWLACSIFQLTPTAIIPWEAGMFSLLQLGGSLLLLQPLRFLLDGGLFQRLNHIDELKAEMSLLFGLYLPCLLLGLFSLVLRLHHRQPGEPQIRGKIFQFLRNGGIPGLLLLTVVTALLLTWNLEAGVRHLIAARLLAKAGLSKAAAGQVKKSLQLSPDLAEAHFLDSLLTLRESSPPEQLAQARVAMERAIQLAPQKTRFYQVLSQIYAREGNLADAMQVASKAVQIRPDDPLLWASLADLAQRNQNPQDAIKWYKEALKLAPNDSRTLNNLAYTMAELDLNLGDALELARRSVELDPTTANNRDTLAWLLHKNGQTAEAYSLLVPIVQNTSTAQSAEIDFHFAVISHELDLLANPYETFQELLLRPESRSDPELSRQIRQQLQQLPELLPAPTDKNQLQDQFSTDDRQKP